MPNRLTTLIETWLPIEQIGAESLRERGASSALPPLYFLHVWWARRPLTVSRAAVVASLLPDYEAVAAHPDLRRHFPTRERYEAWFLRLMGVFGDPAATRKLLQVAKQRGVNLGADPYGYPRAFTINPEPDDLALLRQLLAAAWGKADLTVLDPFAGGGSIPFEAIRYGFHTIANELNPVAAVILKATLDYPARYGESLPRDIRRWGREWAKRVEQKLAPFFPKREGENIFAYLWARTVACPTTGKPVPLSPNWWLAKGKKPVAVRLRVDPSWDAPRFKIVSGDAIDFDPDEGTVSRGVGRSPWTGEAIPGDYIKREAQAGRMGQMLYAVALKHRGGFDFRAPTEEDLAAVRRAEAEVARRRPLWEVQDLIPTEPIPEGLKTAEPIRYGMNTWASLFAPRQLLALATFVEILRDLREELRAAMDADRAVAIETYLALVIDKCADWNARLCTWHPSRQIIGHVFQRHDFAFIWSPTEFDASANLLPWAVNQIVDAYKGIAKLLTPKAVPLEGKAAAVGRATILQGSATHLAALPDGSVDAIITDPPYYNSVPYADLSDFFYVWLKRTVGHLYPDLFATPFTPKGEEITEMAGWDPVRYPHKDKQFFEQNLAQAFREIHRMLKPDGIAVIVYAHKSTEGWETVINALLDSGLVVSSAWPLSTEMQSRLRANESAALASSIYIVARKVARQPTGFYNEVREKLRRHLERKLQRLWEEGIGGADFFIAAIGSAIEVFGKYEKIMDYEGHVIRADRLLEEVRTLATDFAVHQILHNGFAGEIDPLTRFYVLWRWNFGEARVPFDEAHKLAQSCGIDLAQEWSRHGTFIKKERQFVRVLGPHQRRVEDMAVGATGRSPLLDVLHRALRHWEAGEQQEMVQLLASTGYGASEVFYRVAQAISETLPIESKEKKLLDGCLAGRKRVRKAVRESGQQGRLFEDVD